MTQRGEGMQLVQEDVIESLLAFILTLRLQNYLVAGMKLQLLCVYIVFEEEKGFYKLLT